MIHRTTQIDEPTGADETVLRDLAANGLPPQSLTRQDAYRFCGLTRWEWDRRRAAGTLPAPILERRDGRQSRKQYWLVEDLRAWVRAGYPSPEDMAAAGRASRRRR